MPDKQPTHPIKTVIWACLLAFAVIVLDAWSKFAVFHTFEKSPLYLIEYPVFKNLFGIDFSLTYTPNKGAAWGLLSSWQNTLLTLRIGTILALFGYLVFFNKRPQFIIPITLIAIGALGNVLDSFLYGHVIDMFLFNFWGHPFAVFNVADASITIGVAWLFLSSFLEKNSEPKVLKKHADSSAD